MVSAANTECQKELCRAQNRVDLFLWDAALDLH